MRDRSLSEEQLLDLMRRRDRSLSNQRIQDLMRKIDRSRSNQRTQKPFPPPCPDPGCGAETGDWHCNQDGKRRRRHDLRTLLVGGGEKAVADYKRSGEMSPDALEEGRKIWDAERKRRSRSGKRKPSGTAISPEQIDAIMRFTISHDCWLPKSDPAHRLYNKRLGNLTPEEAKELLAALKRAAAAAS